MASLPTTRLTEEQYLEIERAALTPKAPYLVTQTMIKGFEREWAQANVASRPYLPYNIDKAAIDAGGM